MYVFIPESNSEILFLKQGFLTLMCDEVEDGSGAESSVQYNNIEPEEWH